MSKDNSVRLWTDEEKYKIILLVNGAMAFVYILILSFLVFKYGLLITILVPAFLFLIFIVAVFCGMVVNKDEAPAIGLKSLLIMLVTSVVGLVVFSLFFAQNLPISNEDTLRDFQIFLVVGSSGMLGGVMRIYSGESLLSKMGPDVWKIFHSLFVALFVSIVLFFLLRAGIVKEPSIDTFNVWGVAGVSAITGFFSEKIIKRFQRLFNEVLGEGDFSRERNDDRE
ncbi:hypothetical protein ACFO0E_13300 [Chromohalobacter beijerinckii]|uniref:Intracellular septation protein A n=1 Tax=Chromohalobacter beijerinckii TaxID=86179 RepID=A0ABV8XGY4_9GAMM|nr:hypothetical protein [Chromohalobacter beijerinckii]MCK0764847.1 hypothetical protein [Chromohalobacter beijerinckii]